MSPRTFRVVALPAPTEREQSQMYFQRYVAHLPAAGEVVIFDRSWYNRAGVERVMGFCTEDQTKRFLDGAPRVEQAMIDSGIVLLKYWLEVSADEQTRRLQSRIDDPRKCWKLTDMDLESYSRWFDYSRARDAMFAATDTAWAPWYVVDSERQEAHPPERHHPPAGPDPVPAARAQGRQAAQAPGRRRLPGPPPRRPAGPEHLLRVCWPERRHVSVRSTWSSACPGDVPHGGDVAGVGAAAPAHHRNATSLDQVIAESSSSKGAFFHHFRSKADLALRLVERYVVSDLGQLDAGLAAAASIEDPAARSSPSCGTTRTARMS